MYADAAPGEDVGDNFSVALSADEIGCVWAYELDRPEETAWAAELAVTSLLDA